MSLDQKARRSSLTLMTAALSLNLLTGCSDQDLSKYEASRPPATSDTLFVNTYKGPHLTYRHTLNLKPEYYTGAMPLVYDRIQTFTGSGMSDATAMIDKYTDFDVVFMYDERQLLSGALAFDKNQLILAQAKVNFVWEKPGTFPNVIMEEFHMSPDRKITYHSKSVIDKSTGAKTAETQAEGKKKGEYFFLMPVGLHGR